VFLNPRNENENENKTNTSDTFAAQLF